MAARYYAECSASPIMVRTEGVSTDHVNTKMIGPDDYKWH